MNTHYDMTALNERLTFIGIDHEAKGRLRGLKGVIASSIEAALDEFYTKVRQTPQTNKFFNQESHISSAKKRQQSHWDLIATADFDERYVAGVSTVGKTHARLGLEPRWYIGGYALVIEQLVGAIVDHRAPRFLGKAKSREMAKDISIVLKAAMLDMDYAISVYLDELAEARAKAQQEKERGEADRQAALSKLSEALDQLADGNLEARLSTALPSEFQAMVENFNASVGSLHDAIADVHATSSSISGGAEGLASAADELSRRTEQQAASLEESSAALHELAESVRLTADNAAQASKVVVATRAEAEQSGEVVNEAVGAMGKIKSSSEEIAAIIGVIDEIAFQTNLLALNAGVEAARAGDAGRGFAVVAQEVRGLAQRCAASAKEIKELISTSAEHVSSGVSSVGAAGQALGKMIERIEEITQLMTGIAAAATEQSRAISEVNVAVGQMDQITQKNASMVQETTSETQALMSEAVELTKKINGFRIAKTASHQSLEKALVKKRQSPTASGASTSRRSYVTQGSSALAVDAQESVEDWREF